MIQESPSPLDIGPNASSPFHPLKELTGFVAKDFSHEHDWSQLEGFEEGRCRETNISQCLVLAPGTEHVGNAGEGILVNDGGLGPSGFQVEPHTAAHDEGPESIGKDQGVGIGEEFSRVARIPPRQHAFL